MNITRVQGIGSAVVVAAIATVASMTGAAAGTGSRIQEAGTCDSVAGINAYARQYGFTPRYVAQMCNKNAGTHWNVMDFSD